MSGDHTDASISGTGEWLVGPRFQGQHYAVSAMLRQAFEDVAAEPLPGPIVELLRQLDAPSLQQSTTSAGDGGNQSERRTLRP